MEKHKESDIRIKELIINSIGEKNKIIKKLAENQDYIKEQNNKILENFKHLEELKNIRKEQKVYIEKVNKKILEEIKERSLELKESYKQVERLLEKIEKIILS